MRKWWRLVWLLGVSLCVFANWAVSAETKAPELAPKNHLVFTGEKQVLLSELDQLGRAQAAHIQLQEKDEPTYGREPRLSHDPVGWKNYQFYYGDGKNKAWLMSRGHLLGYQFSGLNNEARNLVPLTVWLNAGAYKGSQASNADSMLYYEQGLDRWLSAHPDKWLDYRVTPIYVGDELLPRQIELQYVGLDSKGKLETITLGGRETVDEDGMTHVLLDNVSPNATIDYATGYATNTVASAQVQEAQASYASQEATNPQEESRLVYVARQGRAEVYWYDQSNMPANTNWSRVVTMTEAEAKAQGKRHTSKE